MDELIEKMDAQLLDYARRIDSEERRQRRLEEEHPTDYTRRRAWRASKLGTHKLYGCMHATAAIMHHATGARSCDLIESALRRARKRTSD